jgi:hypothetical protein
VDRFHETNQIERVEQTHTDLILMSAEGASRRMRLSGRMQG